MMRRRLVPDIVNLQAFESAARHQNFSRAAAELNLTPSAISRQIAELEQQTGLRLFERIRQRVVLSEAGLRLLSEVKDLLLHSERFMIGAVNAGRMKSSLRIATLPTFGGKWLVPRLGSFVADYPDVAVTVESRSRPFSFDEDGFDLAIHFGQPTWAGGVCTFLCHETVLPVASPPVIRELQIRTPADLAPRTLLHMTTRPKLWAEWFAVNGSSADEAYVGPRFDQFSMVLAAAVAGLGIALLPTYLIEDELRGGALLPVLDQPMSTDNAYYIVRPESKQSQQTVDTFEKWLLSQVPCQYNFENSSDSHSKSGALCEVFSIRSRG